MSGANKTPHRSMYPSAKWLHIQEGFHMFILQVNQKILLGFFLGSHRDFCSIEILRTLYFVFVWSRF